MNLHKSITRNFGVQILNADLKSVTNEQIIEYQQLLAHHGLLVFKDQSLSDLDLSNFGKRFGNGSLVESARKISLNNKQLKEIAYLTNLLDRNQQPLGFGGNHTDFWHSDQEFRENPASVSVIYCLIPSPLGGNTSFASTKIDNINIDEHNLNILRNSWSTRRPAKSHDNAPDLLVAHPVVISNKHTGQDYLYVSENLINFTGEQTTELTINKKSLLKEILKPNNIYSHQWVEGDLILYDNTQLIHRREEFSGLRFLKALKIHPDGNFINPPDGRIVNESHDQQQSEI